jgi:hypothetical protein
MTDVKWKQLPMIEHPAGRRRTSRDRVGTAYHTLPTRKEQRLGVKRAHGLYVKIGEDRWLCYRGSSIEQCLDQLRRTPANGALARDHTIGGAIGSVSAAGHVVSVRVAPLELATKPQRPLSARLAPDEIWRRLEERGATVVRRKVSAKALAAAEKALRFEFPPSYIELVVNHGAPAIGRDARAPAEQLSFAVLVPKEIVKLTRELRGGLERDMFEDPASLPRVQKQLANAVWFQLGRDDGEGYVFLLDTVDRTGEMRIADYHHGWLEQLDWRRSSRAVFRSLSAAMVHAATQIAEGLPG